MYTILSSGGSYYCYHYCTCIKYIPVFCILYSVFYVLRSPLTDTNTDLTTTQATLLAAAVAVTVRWYYCQSYDRNERFISPETLFHLRSNWFVSCFRQRFVPQGCHFCLWHLLPLIFLLLFFFYRCFIQIFNLKTIRRDIELKNDKFCSNKILVFNLECNFKEFKFTFYNF